MSFSFVVLGRDLPVMDKTASDPYFKFYVNGDKVYKSKKIKDTVNPNWEKFNVSRSEFGQFPKMVDVKVEVWDDDFGKNDYMGSGYFKILKLLGDSATQVELVNEKTQEPAGHLLIRVTEE